MGTSGILILMVPALLALVGFCALAARKICFEWRWEGDWEGHRIVVKTWFNLFLQGGEELIVDGVVAPKYRPSRPRSTEDLYGELRVGDRVHRVHAHIRPKGFFGLGCSISVDGVLVGGDLSEKKRN